MSTGASPRDGAADAEASAAVRLWRALTEPHPRVEGVAERRRARLAAALLLVLMPMAVLFVGIYAFAALVGGAEMTDLLSVSALAAILVGYAMVRSPRVEAGVLLVLAALFLAIWVPVFSADDVDMTLLYYALIPVLLGGLLLHARIAMSIGAANIVAATIVPTLLRDDGGFVSTEAHLSAVLFLLVATEIGLLGAFYLERSMVEVERANERFRQADAFRLQLLNTVAHDLAAPLTPIGLQLRLLEGKDGLERNTAILKRNVRLLERLVTDVKDLAKVEGGHLELRAGPTDLSALARETAGGFEDAAKERGLRLKVDTSAAPMVQADHERIVQVFYNLMTNAIKFTPAGGHVHLAVEERDGHAHVRVQDTGRGLEPDEIARLFKPFSQVHDRAEVEERGTGLGLFITRGIIEAHGGQVGVESAGRGQGSTFWFALPVAPG